MIASINHKTGSSVSFQEMQTVHEMLKCARNLPITPFFDFLITVLERERPKWEAITREVTHPAIVERPNEGDGSR